MLGGRQGRGQLSQSTGSFVPITYTHTLLITCWDDQIWLCPLTTSLRKICSCRTNIHYYSIPTIIVEHDHIWQYMAKFCVQSYLFQAHDQMWPCTKRFSLYYESICFSVQNRSCYSILSLCTSIYLFCHWSFLTGTPSIFVWSCFGVGGLVAGETIEVYIMFSCYVGEKFFYCA